MDWTAQATQTAQTTQQAMRRTRIRAFTTTHNHNHNHDHSTIRDEGGNAIVMMCYDGG